MTLALDANANATQLRDGDPIGGIFTPQTTTGWHRLMPVSTPRLSPAAGQENLLEFVGGFRADIDDLDLPGWRLMILNTGYVEEHSIQHITANHVVHLSKPLQFHEGLSKLGTALRAVIYPKFDIPWSVTYKADADDAELEIGFSQEKEITPTIVKPLVTLEKGQMAIFHTTHAHKMYYSGAAANDRISWGEHYLA